MASSASQQGAARAPPSPDQLVAFYELADKRTIAGQLCRYARDAELSAQAAVQAEVLFEDSLVVAGLRLSECRALVSLLCVASGAEKVALVRRVWPVIVSLVPLLRRRLEADTLLPGSLREEELAYEAHAQAVIHKARNKPVPPSDVLRESASVLGYNILLEAITRCLDLVRHPFWPQLERKMLESFVLQGLDVIPRTAGIPAHLIAGEDRVLMTIERHMPTSNNYDPSFYAAVLRKWRSDAVSSVLRARGVLQTGIAKCEQSQAEFEALKRADITKHGLRDCALPSCAKTEKTVKEFAGCTGCRSVVYCCPEHQALDWKDCGGAQKGVREMERARLATEEAAAEEAHATEEEVAFNLRLG